jgi:hypothetical protein
MTPEMDTEFAKWLITLGVGGILAAFIFMFYRKDVKQFTELWKTQTDMLVNVIVKNTESNVELIGLIKAQKEPVITRAEVEQIIAKHVETTKSRRMGV